MLLRSVINSLEVKISLIIPQSSGFFNLAHVLHVVSNFILQVVAVISAMKMEMAVQASLSGTVRATHVTVGDKIDPEDLLVEIQELTE